MAKQRQKSTKAECEARLQKCIDFIIDHTPSYVQFIRWYMPKFERGRSVATNDWNAALIKVSEEGNMKTDAKRWRRIQQLEKQYDEAETAKEKATIVMMMSKLEGIDINKHEIDASINVEKPIFNLGDNVETDDSNS